MKNFELKSRRLIRWPGLEPKQHNIIGLTRAQRTIKFHSLTVTHL